MSPPMVFTLHDLRFFVKGRNSSKMNMPEPKLFLHGQSFKTNIPCSHFENAYMVTLDRIRYPKVKTLNVFMVQVTKMKYHIVKKKMSTYCYPLHNDTM